jgi:hypothetical protein
MSQDHITAALELRKELDAEVRRVRSDVDLSPPAKARHITEAWRRTTVLLVEHREAYRAQRAERIATAKRRLFGPTFPADNTPATQTAVRASYRDALERAERATGLDDGMALLRRAEVTGDELQARAVGAIAHERGWSSVVHAFAESRRDDAELLAEYRELQQSAEDRSSKLAESMAFGLPVRPPEALGSAEGPLRP